MQRHGAGRLPKNNPNICCDCYREYPPDQRYRFHKREYYEMNSRTGNANPNTTQVGYLQKSLDQEMS
jgi:hypothetical protein